MLAVTVFPSVREKEGGNTWWRWRHCPADTNSTIGKSSLGSSLWVGWCSDPLITTMSAPTIIWPWHDPNNLDPTSPEHKICPTLIFILLVDKAFGITGWNWPEYVPPFTYGSGYDLPLCSLSQGQTSLCYLSFPNGTQRCNRDICLQW